MLGPLNQVAEPALQSPDELLAAASAAVYGRLHPVPLGEPGDPENPDDGHGPWLSVADLLVDPDRLERLVETAGRRFRSDDRALVVAQVARESVAALTTVAVDLWARQRRLFDLSSANVLLRAGGEAVVPGLRRAALATLVEDPLAERPGVQVVSEAELFDRLVDQSLGYPVPAGETPPGRPASIAAVSAIIAAVRRVVRCGDRHLWGSAALAAANALVTASHTVGPRADQDRLELLGARPDLARTIELVTVDDELDDGRCGEITFARRRTCCLLFKLPDNRQCSTCSLGDRATQLAGLSTWYRSERRRLSAPLPNLPPK